MTGLEPIVLALTALVATVPEFDGEVLYPAPRNPLNRFPCAVVEWARSQNLRPRTFEGDLGVRNHFLRVIVFTGAGYYPDFASESVGLYDAIAPVLDADPSLGGIVTNAEWSGAENGKVTFSHQEYTGFVLNVVVEEK